MYVYKHKQMVAEWTMCSIYIFFLVVVLVKYLVYLLQMECKKIFHCHLYPFLRTWVNTWCYCCNYRVSMSHLTSIPVRLKVVSIFPDIIQFLIDGGWHTHLVAWGNGESTHFLVCVLVIVRNEYVLQFVYSVEAHHSMRTNLWCFHHSHHRHNGRPESEGFLETAVQEL